MFNIENYLIKKKIQYNITNTNQIIIMCPNCKQKKLYINNELGPKYGEFLCFKSECTHIRGRIIKLVSLLESCDIKSAVHIVSGKDINKYNNIKNLRKRKLILQNTDNKTEPLQEIEMPKWFKKINKPIPYLKKRKVTEKMIEMYNILYDDYSKRIIFPISLNGKLIGWQARDILGEDKRHSLFPDEFNKFGYLKMKNSSGLQKKKVLYNYDNVRDKEIIIIVEGPFDVIKTMNSVALLGKELSQEQLILLLETNAKRIIIATDPEEEDARNKIYQQLRPFFEMFYLKLPLGTDPGDYTEEKMKYFLKTSVYSFNNTFLKLQKKNLTK